ncbi:MAG: hypothetical protein ABL958_19710 [Bdellovibrionia bacterium]
MKSFLLIVLGLFMLTSQAFALGCYKNEGNQNVKKICLLENAKGKVKGFLLWNANETKSYLAVTRTIESGYGAQEYGHLKWAYTVKAADASLTVTDPASSKIEIVRSWEYSSGGTYLSGQTPGGRALHATIESSD